MREEGVWKSGGILVTGLFLVDEKWPMQVFSLSCEKLTEEDPSGVQTRGHGLPSRGQGSKPLACLYP